MARIADSRVLPYALPLKRPWRSAGGRVSTRAGWLFVLDTDDGGLAWGDCAPLAEGTDGQGLLAWHPCLRGLDAGQARACLARAGLGPAARCAVDVALSDWLAREAGMPLARWLNPAAALTVRCNAVLGVLDETVAARVQEALAQGFSVLKLKVGVFSLEGELARLRELAAALPPGVQLRLDANRAWDEPDARAFLAGLDSMPVEMVEEPLARPDPDRLSRLQRETGIDLALDESLSELGMEAVFTRTGVRRLVLKPTALGGLDHCLEWARRARSRGMRCVATTALDSAVGTLAAAHLAAALDNGLAHGLATSSWFERDVGGSPPVSGGVMRLDSLPGLGFAAVT